MLASDFCVKGHAWDKNLRNGNLKAGSNGRQHLLVILAADKGDGKTLGTETTGTTDTMQVRVGITRHIIVDGQVDTLNVNTTSEDVSRDADTLVELFELLVSADTARYY